MATDDAISSKASTISHHSTSSNGHDAIVPFIGTQLLNTMEVSITPMNKESTTITNSVKSGMSKVIPKYYVILKSQRINTLMKRDDPDWTDLKNNVQIQIDSELKERMVREAQKVRLQFGNPGRNFLIDS